MTNVLVINASLNGESGNSSLLTREFVTAAGPDVTVTTRNLASDIGHLEGAEMQAWMTPAEQRSPAQQSLAALSDAIVAEVQAADVLVIGMPLYNFGVPSTFKSWVDRLARAGITFAYTENGPVGLLADKRVIVLAARGGQYAGTPKDTQTPYLKDFFAFLGLSDIEFVYAEGLAMGDAARDAAMAAASTEIKDLAASLGAATRSAA